MAGGHSDFTPSKGIYPLLTFQMAIGYSDFTPSKGIYPRNVFIINV
jgi:hypothetical protein